MWDNQESKSDALRKEADDTAQMMASSGFSVVVPHTMYCGWEDKDLVSELRIRWIYKAEVILVIREASENMPEISLARALGVPVVYGVEGLPKNDGEASRLRTSGKIS